MGNQLHILSIQFKYCYCYRRGSVLYEIRLCFCYWFTQGISVIILNLKHRRDRVFGTQLLPVGGSVHFSCTDIICDYAFFSLWSFFIPVCHASATLRRPYGLPNQGSEFNTTVSIFLIGQENLYYRIVWILEIHSLLRMVTDRQLMKCPDKLF